MKNSSTPEGMISASRVHSSGTHLFGSDIEHSTYITLDISTAERSTSYGGAIHPKDSIIRVAMTASQWADLLCNMGTVGVPCTIKRRIDVEVEPYVQTYNRVETAMNTGVSYLEDAATKGLLTKVRTLIENSKLSKKAKGELEVATRLLDENLKSNASFYLKSFIDEAEKVVVESKTEIEANRTYITNALGKIKLEELQSPFTPLVAGYGDVPPESFEKDATPVVISSHNNETGDFEEEYTIFPEEK